MVEQEVKKTGNAFVLVNNIPFGKKLADSIENAYFVYGQDESEVRKKIYALFAEHDDVEQKYKFDKILVEYTKSFDMNSDAVVY
jgi:ribosomal protein S24E